MRTLAAALASATLAAVALSAQTPQLPPQVMQRDRQTAQLAIETAALGPATPIPLIGARERTMGAVYDQFITAVVIARAQTAAGGTPTPDAILAHPNFQSRAVVVVAYPVDCEGKSNRPTAIRWAIDRSLPMEPRMMGQPLRGDAGQALLPGVSVPSDALVVAHHNLPLMAATVEIDYDNPVCAGASKTASLSVGHALSRDLASAFAGIKLPDQFASLPSPSTVRMSVTLDPQGRVRFPTQVQGPTELGPVAIAAMNARTFQPGTSNGVPAPSYMLVTFVFTMTGQPAPAAPFVRPPPSPATAPAPAGPPITSSTTVGGRPPGLQSTDEAGLTAATSKCAIATDAAYGLTPGSPVKVGGDFNNGPARERQYLMALRGPTGQGLSIVRRGATMSPDKQTILDLWEVTYIGLAKPIQIFLDQYHEEPLKAPQGLVCAAPVAR